LISTAAKLWFAVAGLAAVAFGVYEVASSGDWFGSFVLATVVIVVPPYEEVCSGSAVVRAAGELDAVARAVLDATNRRLPQLR